MKLMNPLLVVKNMEKSVAFYQRVFGLQVVTDFGANKTLTGGLVLQTEDSWKGLTGCGDIRYGGADAEIYFEEDDFDMFAENLRDVEYVHPVIEHPWGQRVVRFYDPDCHMIEVGENIHAVCRRFMERGLTLEQTAQRMDVPLAFVQDCMRQENHE